MIGRPSIRVRLAMWHAAAVFVVLVVTALALHMALRRRIVGDFDRGQRASLAMVQRVFELDFAEFHSVEATVTHVRGEVVFPDRLLEFVRPDGSPDVEPLAHHADERTLAPPERVMAAPLHPTLAPGWQLRMRASMQGPDRTQRLIDTWLLVTTPLFALIAGCLGWMLAGRALAPIAAMADAAEQIGGHETEGRIPVAAPGDELGRLGAQFNALLDRLHQSSQQQRRFLADAAHELRTPTARMLTQVEMMLTDETDTTRRAGLEQVRDDLHRSSGLMGSLLQLARTEAGETPAADVAIFLDDIALGEFDRAQALGHARGVRLTTGRMEETPIRGDPESLSRVIANLLDNAVRYTPTGGEVTLQVWPEAPAAFLEVRDTGIGLEQDEQDRVFERFFRGKQARQLAPHGTGLGLAIARAILGQHGGSMALTSQSGQGTRVTIRLPFRSEQ